MSILARNLRLKRLTSYLPISTIYQGSRNYYPRMMIQLNTNEAILVYEEGEPTFRMMLRYIQPDLNIDRQFNFLRNVDEPVNNFLVRMEYNITQIIVKKFQRGMKKNSELKKLEMEKYSIKNITFVKDDQVLDSNLPCKVLLDDSANIRLNISSTTYVVRSKVPYIVKLQLPACILVNFPVYPSKFETVAVIQEKCTFSWYRKEDRTWIHVGEGFFYIPSKEDLGCQIKLSCLPRNDKGTGPMVELMSSVLVEEAPESCPFDKRHSFTKSKLSGKSFRVTSYNILAGVYTDTQLAKDVLFPYCASNVMSMDYRKLLILKELIGYNADIICLQEVDRSIYKYDLALSLNILHYGSVFNPKNDLREGLAIFYNEDRFDRLSTDYSVLSQGTDLEGFKSIWDKIQNDTLKQLFGNRNTIIQAVTLKSKENNEILVIGNTHLYFLPKAVHLRLLQAYYSVMYLRKIAKEMKEQHPECNVSILLCGDFNSDPMSEVFQLITKKHISEYQENVEIDPSNTLGNLSIDHDINFSSACGTPKYTNFTTHYAQCLDYIFYQTDGLDVEQIIPMPSEEELSMHTALPSPVFPSDHISICVDLKWTK